MALKSKNPIGRMRFLCFGELDDVRAKLVVTSLELQDRKLESFRIVEINGIMSYPYAQCSSMLSRILFCIDSRTVANNVQNIKHVYVRNS